jgi:hypothetical protein
MEKIMEEGLVNKGGGIGSLYGKGIYFGNGVFGKEGPYEAALRLKKPSELKGSKEIYPKTTKAMAHDTGLNPKTMSDLSRTSQTYGLSGVHSKYNGKIEINDVGINKNFFDSGLDSAQEQVYQENTSNKYLDKKKKSSYPPMGNSQFLYKTKHISPNLLVREK